MTQIRGVLFDFNGTLARCVPPWAEKHASVLERHGLAAILDDWGDQWDLGPPDGAEHVEASASRRAYRDWELARLRARARGLGVGENILELLVVDLDRATKGVVMEAYDDVPPLLAQLRQRGVVVAICSNWSWDLEPALEAVGLNGMFDVVVSSAHVGARKPHPRIFTATLERCGLRAGEALFVGDTLATDVEGPMTVGMRAVHLCRTPDGGEVIPRGAIRICDLHELAVLLDRGAWASPRRIRLGACFHRAHPPRD